MVFVRRYALEESEMIDELGVVVMLALMCVALDLIPVLLPIGNHVFVLLGELAKQNRSWATNRAPVRVAEFLPRWQNSPEYAPSISVQF